eukprot:Pgem_evm1s4294
MLTFQAALIVVVRQQFLIQMELKRQLNIVSVTNQFTEYQRVILPYKPITNMKAIVGFDFKGKG